MHSETRRAALIKGFPLFWGVITAAYASVVLYRIASLGQLPGMPTVAGCSAVTAVWAEFVAFVRHGLYWRLVSVLALLITIATNAIVAVDALLDHEGLPLARILFTLLFVLVLLDRLHQPPVFR